MSDISTGSRPRRLTQPDGAGEMWHVTLTLGGAAVDADGLRCGLERLADERPFLLSARYATDRAEVRYWEEAWSVEDAAALALRLWGEHRDTADLPAWHVIGLEVVNRATYRHRVNAGAPAALLTAGGIRPF